MTSGVDLRKCVPGQKLRTRDGTILTYSMYEPEEVYPHYVQYSSGNSETMADEGTVYFVASSSKDIVEILPLETEKMTSGIDLRNCVPGQKLLTRDGAILTYKSYDPDEYYHHKVLYPNGKYGTRNDDGSTLSCGELHSVDIVEILPLETENMTTDFPEKEYYKTIIEYLGKKLSSHSDGWSEIVSTFAKNHPKEFCESLNLVSDDTTLANVYASSGRIAAIKKAREMYGWDLKTSREYIENLARKRNLKSPNVC